ncbi:MAG: phosphohydrolase [Magnetovibrio sp.]|nr:phosphohydrolase [Magnetovibrio sp.]
MDRRYPARPIVGVGTVVMDSDMVLMIKRGKPPRQGSWSLPGGAQELGETIREAARREVREETGLQIEIFGLIDVVDSVRSDADDKIEYHYTLIDLAGYSVGGTLMAGGDAQDCRWFTRTEINAMDIWSETKRIISLAGDKFGAIDKSNN